MVPSLKNRLAFVVLFAFTIAPQAYSANIYRRPHVERLESIQVHRPLHRFAPRNARPQTITDPTALANELGPFKSSLRSLSQLLTKILAEIQRLQSLLGQSTAQTPTVSLSAPGLPSTTAVAVAPGPVVPSPEVQDGGSPAAVPSNSVPLTLGSSTGLEQSDGAVIIPTEAFEVPSSSPLLPDQGVTTTIANAISSVTSLRPTSMTTAWFQNSTLIRSSATSSSYDSTYNSPNLSTSTLFNANATSAVPSLPTDDPTLPIVASTPLASLPAMSSLPTVDPTVPITESTPLASHPAVSFLPTNNLTVPVAASTPLASLPAVSFLPTHNLTVPVAASTPLASLPPSGTSSAARSTASSIAVYFGQQASQASDLLKLCSSPGVDIVALAFLNNFFSSGSSKKYPTTAFGSSCQGPNEAQQLKAPQLQDCSALGQYITQCQQQHNTKILVSLGGYIASSSFQSAEEATGFAETLWDLFGAGTGDDPKLRPFGDAVVDGFDDDNEDHSTAYWFEFATALRSQFAKDTSRQYYLSAAPQCPRPDQSIPRSVLSMADFVFVQFYNNPPCSLGSSGFIDSVKAWSSDLAQGTSSQQGGPKLFIGMPAWDGGGSGYLPPADMAETIDQVKNLGLPNFGGVMMWEGSKALSNVDAGGKDYIAVARDVLTA